MYRDQLGLFRALVLYLQGNEGPEKETLKNFNFFPKKGRKTEPESFQDLCMNDIPIVKNLV